MLNMWEPVWRAPKHACRTLPALQARSKAGKVQEEGMNKQQAIHCRDRLGRTGVALHTHTAWQHTTAHYAALYHITSTSYRLAAKRFLNYETLMQGRYHSPCWKLLTWAAHLQARSKSMEAHLYHMHDCPLSHRVHSPDTRDWYACRLPYVSCTNQALWPEL